MIYGASKLFSNILGRLRGSKKENKEKKNANPAVDVRDALYPMRHEMLKNGDEKQSPRLTRRSSSKKRMKKRVPNIRVTSEQNIDIDLDFKKLSSPITLETEPSMVFNNEFLDMMKRQRSESLLPEWYRYSMRRSTTIGTENMSEEFYENLKDFTDNGNEAYDNMFSNQVSNTSDIGGGALTPTPSLKYQFSGANRLSVAANTWKNLSLSRSRASTVRGRGTRGKSAFQLHREAALSCSLALASLQSALRRSTLAPPEITDAMFAEDLADFIDEHQKAQEKAWKKIEKMAPNVKSKVVHL